MSAAWDVLPMEPSWKGCGECREDVLGPRIALRPRLSTLTPEGQKPEGLIVRACSNCGHVTTMGPILPDVAARWVGGDA